MIFVTVGNHDQGFDRLIKKMDEIAGKIDEKVIMQTGYTQYKPVNAESFDFIESFEEIKKLNREARVVICHAGAGSILTALEQQTPVIVVPRLKKYNEHLNDHQIEIAEAMAENNRVKIVYDVEDLYECLTGGLNQQKISCENQLAVSLKKYLSSLEC